MISVRTLYPLQTSRGLRSWVPAFSPVVAAAAIAVAALGVAVHPASGATVASDSASNSTYNGGSFSGLNGGSGFGSWAVTPGTANNGSFVGTNNATAGADLGAKVFDIWNSQAVGNTVSAVRPFTGTLTAGQTFSVDDTMNSGANGALLGFSLQDGSGNTLFDFHTQGGTNQYYQTDKTQTNTVRTGVAYNYHVTDSFAFTLLDATGNYSLTVTGPSQSTNGNGVSGGSQTYTGTINNASGIAQAVFYNNGGGASSDVQFTNLAVTPEPASVGLLALAGLGLLARRRRTAGSGA